MKVSAKKTCTFQIIVLLFSSESVKVSTNNTNTFQAFSHKGPRQLFPKCGNLFIGFCSCSLKRITAFNGNNFWKAMLTFVGFGNESIFGSDILLFVSQNNHIWGNESIFGSNMLCPPISPAVMALFFTFAGI